MNAVEILLKSIGLSPEVFLETQRVFVRIADEVSMMHAQMTRIENNTLMILDSLDGNVSAAPTRYDLMPTLDILPPMDHEVAASPRKTNGAGHE